MKKAQGWRQWSLIVLGLAFVGILLVLPLALIFAKALSAGWGALLQNLADDDMRHAIELTLLAAVITVPVNLVFGILLAWCVTRFDFRGRKLLTVLIDIPYATSPVVTGLCYLVIYSSEGALGGWLSRHDIQLMFAWRGIVIVTIFVTSPFVARILIPLMQAQGEEEEQAALTLGASGWQMFRRVTLPNIKWALLYGVILCNARAMGEFGAVSVVSGHIRGETNTMPLHVEILYNEYDFVGAFAVASLLAGLALVTLVAKTVLEWRFNLHGSARH